MKSTRHAPTRCPQCRKILDMATGVSNPEARPTVGSLSVCAYCFSFLQFGEGLILRALTEAEIGALPDDARIELQRARRIMQQMPPIESAIRKSPPKESI